MVWPSAMGLPMDEHDERPQRTDQHWSEIFIIIPLIVYINPYLLFHILLHIMYIYILCIYIYVYIYILYVYIIYIYYMYPTIALALQDDDPRMIRWSTDDPKQQRSVLPGPHWSSKAWWSRWGWGRSCVACDQLSVCIVYVCNVL